MKRQQLLDKIEQAWTAFNDSYAGLSNEQMLTRGVVGDWSVKDILAHVNTWEEEAFKYLPLILRGSVPPSYSVIYDGINDFNNLMTEKKRNLSLSAVMTQLHDTHQQLINYIQNAPEEQFTKETRFRRRIRYDTYGHYPEHTRAILEWKEKMT